MWHYIWHIHIYIYVYTHSQIDFHVQVATSTRLSLFRSRVCIRMTIALLLSIHIYFRSALQMECPIVHLSVRVGCTCTRAGQRSKTAGDFCIRLNQITYLLK